MSDRATIPNEDALLLAGEPGDDGPLKPPHVERAEALLDWLRKHRHSLIFRSSRVALCVWLGMSDRRLREAVEYLREHGHPIMAAKDGGYALAETVAEQREALEAYDKSIMRRLVIRNRWARNIPGATGLQLTLAAPDE